MCFNLGFNKLISIFRDKSRSRDDFLPDSPQDSLLNPTAGGASSSAKRLESYLIRQARAADDFDALAGDNQPAEPRQKGQSSRGLVKRQASRCSSLLAAGGGVGSGAGVPGQYRRNMEAVGEFEQVWGGAREDDSVPLTKELSAEFNRDDNQCCCETPVKLTFEKKS